MRILKVILAGCTALSLNTAVIGGTVLGTTVISSVTSAEAQVYPQRRVVRPVQGRGNVRASRGGRGYGRGVGAAAVGLGVLGVLGAAAAANAASEPPAVYEEDCGWVRRRVYLDDGSYVVRRVRAC